MLCVLAAVLLSVPVAHADVLDQSQTSTTSGSYFIIGTNPSGVQYVIGQIYTAGMDRYLKRVQVYIENDSASPVTGGHGSERHDGGGQLQARRGQLGLRL